MTEFDAVLTFCSLLKTFAAKRTLPELSRTSAVTAVPSSKEAQGLGRKSAFPCPSEKANLFAGWRSITSTSPW